MTPLLSHLPSVFLIAIDPGGFYAWSIQDSVAELAQLADTAGLKVVGSLIQKRDTPDSVTYLGSGKVKELYQLIQDMSVEVVIADDELTPIQQKNLEKALQIKVMDRTGLILDIFARRAQTHEAHLQVETAQLQYLKPRLTRMWEHLSRLGGGVGTRGPGEKQLEIDKRRISTKLTVLKKELEKIRLQRDLHREKRNSIPILTAALIGYTNAGKSTLMNQLTQANVLVENQLFATLDPTTRQLILPNKDTVLLTDTVGFIKKLPHQLIDSFRSTLEVAKYADILLHVVDASHPKFFSFIETANQILEEISVTDKPVILVLNKIDAVTDMDALLKKVQSIPHRVAISALTGFQIDQLLSTVVEYLKPFYQQMTFHIPYHRMDIVNLLHERGNLISIDYQDNIISISLEINRIIGEKIMGMLGRN